MFCKPLTSTIYLTYPVCVNLAFCIWICSCVCFFIGCCVQRSLFVVERPLEPNSSTIHSVHEMRCIRIVTMNIISTFYYWTFFFFPWIINWSYEYCEQHDKSCFLVPQALLPVSALYGYYLSVLLPFVFLRSGCCCTRYPAQQRNLWCPSALHRNVVKQD